MTGPFRTGRKVPRNVYRGDEPLFMAATPELATELVTLLNRGAALRTLIPCGGCGATRNVDRCMGCMHDFGDEGSAWVRKYATPAAST